MATVNVPKGTTDFGTLSSFSGNSVMFGEGNQTITAGLDQSGLATPIVNIDVLQPCAVSVRGSSGSFFKFSLTGVMTMKGQGGAWYVTPNGAQGGNAAVNQIARIKNIGGNQLYLAGGGTAVRLENGGAGYTSIADDTDCTTLVIDGGQVDQLYKSTANTTVHVSNGSFNTGRPITTGYFWGGQTLVKREDSGSTAPTGGTLYVGGNSLVKWCGGNITTLYLFGNARIDLSDVPAACTISTLYASRAALRNSILRGRSYTVTVSSSTIYADDNDAIIS